MQIYVRSYRDTDGDGKGDLRGILEKLDYLSGLGVKGLWLTPIFRSQDKDHGYSVTDYRAVDADLGTMADFDELIEAAHALGMGVVLDYPANHSSRKHPAFELSEDRSNRYRNWYVWRDRDPGGWSSWNPYKPNPWTPDGSSGVFYAIYSDQMPDFNLDESRVMDFHRSNLRFWLNRGVDGIRFDSASEYKNLEGGGQDDQSSAAVSAALAATVREYPNRWVICEATTAQLQGLWAPVRHAQSAVCGAAFGFPVNFIFNEIVASQNGSAGKATDSLNWYFDTFPTGRMGILLANHDYFTATLDGVYRGREYDILGGDLAAYKFAAAEYLFAPGIPFIYYGEEIGMSRQSAVEDHYDQLRAPMSWDAANGFSRGASYRAYADNRATFNVSRQRSDPSSLSSWYQQLIQVRTGNATLQRGEPEPVEGGQKGEPFVYTRVLDAERVWLVYNPGQVLGSVTSSHGGQVSPLFNPGNVAVVPSSTGGLTFSGIPARGVALFKGPKN
jgi:alpha-amylase